MKRRSHLSVGRCRAARRSGRHRGRRGLHGGFSALEIVIVLGLLSILTAVVTPSVIQEIERQVRQAEESQLEEVGEGFKRLVRGQRELPDKTGWAEALASEVGLNPDEVARNSRANQRIYIVHPGFQTKFSGTQTADGLDTRPEGGKVLVLSSIYEPLPQDSIVDDEQDFENIWSTPFGRVPDRLVELGWTGDAEDLKIEKINLTGLFHELKLHNLDDYESVDYTIDGELRTLPQGESISAYFLEGTEIGFADSAGNIIAEEILQAREAFFYKEEEWHAKFPGKEVPEWVLQYMEQFKQWIEANDYTEEDLSDGGSMEAGGPKFHLNGP